MKKLLILLVLILSILEANIDEAKKSYYTKDFKKALPMFEQLSKGGNVEANYYLGTMYAFPYGVKQDYKKAFDYYTLASNKPNKKRLKSMFNIATMYAQGKGVKKNSEKAFNLFKILDKKNIGIAQHMMGIMYENGYGVQKDLKNAILYYKKGCNSKKKYPKSCYYAGDYYEKGIAVKENYSTARAYYKKACDAGIQESCDALNNMKSPESFLEKWLKRSWFSLIIFMYGVFVMWKYRKKWAKVK